MSNIINRISRRLKATADAYTADLTFSGKLANYRLLDELCQRVGLKKVSAVYHEKKDQWIMQYLQNELHEVIEKYQNDTYVGVKMDNAPIWICWWSGEETAPALVKQCIKSIRSNAGSHPVIMITEENYRNYLEVPAYILDKVKSGNMCLAHFSDYLRFSLLAQYGGIWLDATIYCSKQMDEEWFHMPLFTCKGRTGDGKYISDYRWTSFCFGGFQGNIVFRYMCSAFDAYWKKNDAAIDYLLTDYLLNLGYANIAQIRGDLDGVPVNNLHRDDLQAAMNAALPADAFDAVVQTDTILYKLSWRETYSEKDKNGSPSVYSYFLNQ